ncbi:type II secretion system F family protein [Arthrobacter sp. BPSS-3]|uniref:type II secretion system F family protein n=1 Tax=Arthrobacter sp. BPSS-3 TaxID=3366580 RepID=UPI0037DC94B6
MTAPAGSLGVALLLAVAATVLLLDRAMLPRRWLARARHGAVGDPLCGRDPAGGKPPEPTGGLRDPAMMMELIGAMLDAGAGLGRSLGLLAGRADPDLRVHLQPVAAALALGADWDTAWRGAPGLPEELDALREALRFAAVTGAPSSAMLYAQAARMRRQQFRAAERRAAALGVRLVVPLGLCSLPAFVCLGIVPVLLAMLPSGP